MNTTAHRAATIEGLQGARNLRLAERLRAAAPEPPHMGLVREGVLRRAVGLTLEASGCSAPRGSRCRVATSGGRWVDAEVVGFSGDRTYLMPTGDLQGLLPNARVVWTRRKGEVAVGEGLLGRVIDNEGAPLDGKGPIRAERYVPLAGTPINPLSRMPISESLDVGVRAINAVLPIGRGQRVGLFAGSGVGKSTLLGMMTRFTGADVIVVGLIGERGREVRDFVEATLGEEGLRRAVVVAAPADRPPLARLHGALRATAIAEWYRDQGLQVLLLMDSLTRFAQAQREIGLSVGEPPTTRGYPPSVFAKLPALVERAGMGADGRGSITAFYTVLTEGDDQQEPIADASRAILDGHIVLTRRIADAGQYPAIDIEQSVSRVMQDITDAPWREHIRKLKRLIAAYNAQRDLIAIGAYQRGSDPNVDQALARWPAIQNFLGQDVRECSDVAASRDALSRLLDEGNGQPFPLTQ
ncbi:flagellar protein export ATPase FliI [Pseudoxanthomonas spadix]|uniref:flagellar protein export ATPase FliI n=1 Tax=Pseudoxanthomonas spadix TaxID=415229 RepID=UPI000EFEBBDA|nr:flagellar protein export ATPase FliI [Pseudoxanthomonas spadix]MBP3973198.1 flagellar protein export ATPase FliI [Pseudoxanthomonas spadix]RMW95214.1 flagellar protein export ATPase FliI [Pseudoxanthomonas spadix]